VGIRLDEDPELLFRLRRVTATDLVTHATERLTTESSGRSGRRSIASEQLSSVFGIELDAASREGTRAPRARSGRSAGNGRRTPQRPARTSRKD
jgi:hypothetical protein